MGCVNGGSFKSCDEPYHWVKILNNTYAENGVSFKKQCKHCGACGVMQNQNPPVLSEIINEDDSRQYAKDVMQQIQEYRDERIRMEVEFKEMQRAMFKERYHEYLQTDLWKNKRELILKRDDYICQSCLVRQATEVHHFSYESYKQQPGSEKGWELISVCRDCHKREHT
tara:strand:- start:43 stop:549 length:507 start_codon:yes stop_codon:yes gene_type:complete